MAEIDKQKEVIGFWKVAFSVIVGAVFGIIGYLFDNFDKLSNVKLIFTNVAVVFLIVLLIFIANVLIKEIDKIKDL